MNRRCAFTVGLVALIGSSAMGCAATRVESITLPRDRISPLPGSQAVAVSARSLHPGTRRLEVMNLAMEVDEGDYARILEAAIKEELERQGHPVSESALRKLDLTILHVAVLGGVSSTCYVELVVLEPDGAEQGFQAKGGSGAPIEACERALAEAAVTVLNDPEIRSALEGGSVAADASR